MILGIETATAVCSVALVKGGKLLGCLSLDEGLVHSDKLIPLIDQLLTENRTSVREMEGIAVSIGPGSFTGIRVGVMTAKAMSQGLRIPVIGVPTLDGLVYHAEADRFVSPMLDALREEVYTALYEKGDRIRNYKVVSVRHWLEELHALNHEVAFLGEGADMHKDFIMKIMGSKARIKEGVKTSASSIALIGWEKLHKGEGRGHHTLLPLYVRRAWAEVKREAQSGGTGSQD